MTEQQVEREMVRKIADAIYPVLIPFEEQDVAIQAENAKQIDAIARQAWRSFFRGRVECEQTEADLEAALATKLYTVQRELITHVVWSRADDGGDRAYECDLCEAHDEDAGCAEDLVHKPDCILAGAENPPARVGT